MFRLVRVGVLPGLICILLSGGPVLGQITIPPLPGNIVTAVGIPETGATYSGIATQAIISVRGKGAFDGSGNFYFADYLYGVVREVTPSGHISTVVGNGQRGYSGDGGPATSAELNSPWGVTLDAAGNLYIADFRSPVIREVNAATGVISTVAGNGRVGYSGDGGLATSAMLWAPTDVALDAAGNLYIADWGGHVIRKVNASSGIISTVAGNGYHDSNGGGGFSGDGGPATSAELNSPSDLAFDAPGNLYIADSDNNVIRKVNATTGIITTVAGDRQSDYNGDGGPATSAGLNYPESVALDPSGNLYIIDSGNSVVREVDAATNIISTVAGHARPILGGPGGYSGDGGPAIGAELNSPTGIALDSAGNLYIGDSFNDVIRRVNAATRDIATFAGVCWWGYSGDGGPATNSKLNSPGGVAIDADGNLYVSDTNNLVIREVNAATGTITSVVGDGHYDNSGDGGPATSAGLTDPEGIAFDPSGNLYIADSGWPTIRKVDATTGIISTVVGNGHQGYSGDGGPATAAELHFPQGIAFDASGNLYIADFGISVIRRVNAVTGIITTVAGNGHDGYQGDGGPATLAELFAPSDVAVDIAGNLYIADSDNNVIREVNAATGIITTVAGNGKCCNSGDGGPATSAALGGPLGIAVDRSGNLYIADSLSVRRVSAATAIIATVAGDGQEGYSGDGGPATSAGLASSGGVGLDQAGNLYIAGGDRIRVVASSIAGAPIFSLPSGDYDAAQTVTVVDITPGSTIHYTTDGTTPTSSSPAYSGPITVSSSETIEAIATKSGYTTSVASSASYGITQPATTPIFNVAPGTYTSAQTVTISDTTPDAAIYYTTNGTAPTTSSAVYSSSITVASSETIEAIAIASGYSASAVATGSYIILRTQAIAFAAPARSVVYGASPLTLSAAASSGLPVTFSVLAGPATVLGSALHFTGVGTVTVAANQAGNARYASANQITRTITINKAALTVAASHLSVPFGKPIPTLTFSLSGFKYGDTSAVVSGKPALTTAAKQGSLPGNYSIVVASGTLMATNYVFVAENGTLAITAAGTVTSPVFMPGTGTYSKTQYVTITDATPGATIYYALHGATPTTASARYSGPIKVTGTETIKAIAVKRGYTSSTIAAATITIMK